jgi:DNA-binding GntR family transcriptional regulator
MERPGKPAMLSSGSDSTLPMRAGVSRPSLRKVVSNRLRQAILTGEWSDGDRLNEVDIAQWLGVSRGVVREAIRELESSGLIENIPYRGTFVKGLTAERVRELCSLRAVLEEYAIDLAIDRLTDQDVRHLSTLVDEMRPVAIRGEGTELVELDMDFHRQVYSLSGHHLLIDALKQLSGQIQSFILASKVIYSLFPTLEAVVETHEPILSALRERDHQKARQAVRDHIFEVGERLVQILEVEDQQEIESPSNRGV